MEAVSASMGVMAPLLAKLATLLGDQCYKLKGVRKDIKFLRSELTEMNVVLEKLADMERLDGQQKLWRDNVREMAFDIEDCIDVFMYHLGDGDNTDGLLQRTVREIRKLRVRYQIANKVQELKARVMELGERRNRYIGLDEVTASPKVVEIDPRLPALYEAAQNLVGIDGPREEIARWLMEDGESGPTQQLKVVSIVGFGGLGKTTLANQVYNQMKDQFECTSFLSVSKNPDMLQLLKNLLWEVGYRERRFPDDYQKIIDTLREHLANKRYLIVIDDIWSITTWSIIQYAFVQNNYGSRVIITTRIKDVATKCSFDFHGMVYKMQPLDKDNSQTLFFKRLFAPEDGFTEQFRKISEDMLTKCKGVPLAIISIASLLATQGMHVEKWKRIQNYLGSELETNPTLEWMRHVLNLSYSDLSHDLRTCFLYLGIYPEDQKIFKADLIRLWLAEGFVYEKPGFDLDEAAESYFNELINRSMIQPDDCYLGEVISCRVHDLMLDLIVLKCQEENFITIASQSLFNGTEIPVRRLCHQVPYKNLAMERLKLSHCRSLITSPRIFCSTQFPISKFEHLRVLNLMADNRYTFLDLSAVCNLLLLRHLRIREFRLKLPHKIRSLQHLRTLDLLGCSLVTSIPSDVISLSSLCHLTVSSDAELPSGIGKLVSLQTLSAFVMDPIYSPNNVREEQGRIQRGGSSAPYSLDAHEEQRERGEGRRWEEEEEGELKEEEGNEPPLYPKAGSAPREEAGEFVNQRSVVEGCHSSSLSKMISIQEKIRVALYVQQAAIIFLDRIRGYDIPSTSLLNLCSPNLDAQLPYCLERAQRRLQRLVIRKSLCSVPRWMAEASRLAMLELCVEELRSTDVQVLAGLTRLVDLDLTAQATPENIIIYTNTFQELQKFILACDLPCLMFEPGAMPQLQILKLDNTRPAQLEEGCSSSGGTAQDGISPLVGIKHLPRLEEVQVTTNSSKESAYRDAVQSHPRIQDIRATFNICDGSTTAQGLKNSAARKIY